MHILFITDNFPPEVNAPATRTYEHCKIWAAMGHKVTVITCAPNFPAGRVFPGYRNSIFARSKMEGVDVIRVWSFIAANEGFALRIADYVSFMLSAIAGSFFVSKPDIVVGTSPQFFVAVAARIIGFLRRKPWVFELRDLWPESIKAVGALRDGVLYRLLGRLELHLYRSASAVISVTHAFKSCLIERGISANKIFVVTNGANLDLLFPRPVDAALCEKFDLGKKFVIGYVGTHGLAHGLDVILNAASEMSKTSRFSRVVFLMVGDGARKQHLIDRASEMRISNLLFVESVSRDDAVRYMSLLDASIIHLRSDPLFKSVIPSKLFECMAMGIPVLHGVPGESMDIVKSHGVGTTFTPEDSASLIAAIDVLLNDSALRSEISAKGPIAAHNYSRDKLAKDMLSLLIEISEPNSIITS